MQVTLTTYVAAMLVYALWSYITFQTLDKGWVGSLVYLPHGCRVVFYCFFGTRSLPALYLAEITGPTLIYGDQYLQYWGFASIFSLASVVVAVEILKWSRASSFSYSILKKINFANYKFLILVIIISALFNAIFTNLVLGLMNNVDINAIVIARFFIGDVFGAMTFVLWLMIMFNMLKDRRFYPVHDD
ncbi:hypothetical protein OAO53_01190 [Gammaproteobacteria bacterium]|nr:hypothetical protein [Gammaproteobacteria bacterium]MDC0536243.1 hypothetical protein [Gammaproteobacteria bacterium]